MISTLWDTSSHDLAASVATKGEDPIHMHLVP